MACGLHISEIELSDKTIISLAENSILVITGPNNSGKSTFLREISHALKTRNDPTAVNGKVVKRIILQTRGSREEIETYLRDAFHNSIEEDVLKISSGKYNVKSLALQYEEGKTLPFYRSFFIDFLSTTHRLSMASDRNPNYGESLLRKLNSNEEREIRISDVFKRAFGIDLILNRTDVRHLNLRIADRADLPDHKDRLTPKFERWINRQEQLASQGDGMKSFAGVILSLLIDPNTCMLIDEPEAFLHPPQIRHLAGVIARDAPPATQLLIATHSDDFIRGLLDVASDRIIVLRMTRSGNINHVKTIVSEDIRKFWRDPLLRTSDVLSSLFHDVSVVCEGDSDVRFYRALLDATQSGNRDPDFRFFHCGGKDRIPGIVGALRAVGVPVIAVVDIDALADRNKFKILLESQGGNFDEVERQFSTIHSSVERRRTYLSGPELKVRIQQIIEDLDKLPGMSADKQRSLSQLVRDSSPWRRPKEDGYAGLGGADAIQAFRRLSDYCHNFGIIIVSVGELEGFCRVLGREQKNEWLASVLTRDLAADPELKDARDFAEIIRHVARGNAAPATATA